MTATRLDADAVVVGLGGLGSAAASALAARGRSVIGVEQFGPHHDRGSSHGTERIFRYGYLDRAYVRLVAESDRAWQELEAAQSVALLHRVGNLDTGDAAEIEAIAEAMAAEGLPVERLSPAALAERFPGFAIATSAVFQPRGGWVHAAAALDAMRAQAVTAGAALTFDDPVRAVVTERDHVIVETDGRTIRARHGVVTTGAWAHRLLDDHVTIPPIRTTREHVLFFETERRDWPTFVHRDAVSFYGLPTPTGRLKVGGHGTGPVVTDLDADRGPVTPDPATVEFVRRHLPGLAPDVLDATTCLYAETPDEDFVIDVAGSVVIGVGLGGHGFKFLPRLGERLADLATGTSWPGNPFTLGRRARAVGRSGHK